MTNAQAETVARIKAAKKGTGKSRLKLAAERKAAATLPAKPVKALKRPTKASSEPHRTARVRYIEKPTHSDGNPFMAFRAPKELKVAFVKWCKGKGTKAGESLRAYMSKVTGVEVESEGEE